MSEQPIAYEEVPGSRTTQQAIDQPQRERIAYEELQPGDIIQEGDEWQHDGGRWKPYSSLDGSCVQVRRVQRARRPYKITQLQSERDELREALAAEQRAHKVTTTSVKSAQRERDELQVQVDKLRADRDRLRGLTDDLLDEPTAREAQDMLRTWATELGWAADCLHSVNRDEIDTIQRTLISVMERIETMLNPEGGTDGE